MANEMTPTEYAYDTAIGALYTRFNNLPSRTLEEKRVRNAIAKLHNRLLDMSTLDGIFLPTIINPLREEKL